MLSWTVASTCGGKGLLSQTKIMTFSAVKPKNIHTVLQCGSRYNGFNNYSMALGK